MKKLLVVLGILALVPGLAFAQDPSYYLDYYSNNAGPATGAPRPPVSGGGLDQTIRIINVGTGGTPLSSPVGDICANIYVFDNNQEMIACCAERITPNELDSASVGTQLTNNPVTSVVPSAGVIKIVLTPAPSTGSCNPTGSLSGANSFLGVAFATRLQVTGGATFVTETELQRGFLPSVGVDLVGSGSELEFLPTACAFARYLGSGKGICTTSRPGN